MTSATVYSPEKAVARDPLTHGVSSHWARLLSCTVDCPAPHQVRAESIDTTDRSAWTVDLADIDRAIPTLVTRPLDSGDVTFIRDTGLLTYVNDIPATARTRVANLPARHAGASGYDRTEFVQMVPDGFQFAVADEVIR